LGLNNNAIAGESIKKYARERGCAEYSNPAKPNAELYSFPVQYITNIKGNNNSR
jgi:hypothetical protein